MKNQKVLAAIISIIGGITCLMVAFWISRQSPIVNNIDVNLNIIFFILPISCINTFGIFFVLQGFHLLLSKTGQHYLLGQVIKAGTIVIDANSSISILTEDEWQWHWSSLLKENHSGCKLYDPINKIYDYCIQSALMGEVSSILYWGYNLSICGPSDIDGIMKLRSTVGNKFPGWRNATESKIIGLLKDHVAEFSQFITQDNSETDLDSLESFDAKTRELIESELEAMGLKIVSTAVCDFCSCGDCAVASRIRDQRR